MSKRIVAQHRIYVRDRLAKGKPKQFYRLLVFGSPTVLRAFLREQDRLNPWLKSKSGWRDTLGVARYFGIKTLPRKPKQVGIIGLCKQHIGAGVVSHEMVHAAMYATHPGKSVAGFRFTRAYDEVLAWTVGDMTAQFYRWFWKNEKRIKALPS